MSMGVSTGVQSPFAAVKEAPFGRTGSPCASMARDSSMGRQHSLALSIERADSLLCPTVQWALAQGKPAAVVDALRKLPIVMVGNTTCAYCHEAVAALALAAAPIGGEAAVATVWLDVEPTGHALWDALKQKLGQRTVPYVFVGGQFLGGCDATVAAAADGSLSAKVGQAAAHHGLALAFPFGTAPSGEPLKDQDDSGKSQKGFSHLASERVAETVINLLQRAPSHRTPIEQDIVEKLLASPPTPDEGFIDRYVRPALGDGVPRTPPPLFWFPEVVDSHVVRCNAGLMVAICIVAIVCRTAAWTKWMVLGLAVDCALRLAFGAGPSPLGQLSRCAVARLRPHYCAGVPKQFAAGCATFMASLATLFFFLDGFDPQEIIPSCVLAAFACLASLEAVFDYCLGCVMFHWMVLPGWLPPEVYSLGIAATPEAYHVYDEATRSVELREPEQVRLGFPNKPPTAIDTRYKAKTTDHDECSYHVIKYVKIQFFLFVLGMCGLAVMWRSAATGVGAAAGLAISQTVGDVLAVLAAVAYILVSLLYAAKWVLYPRKVAKEWMCPLRCNLFVVPPAALALLAFAVAGRFAGAATLAKVLFWAGAPAALLVMLYTAARFFTDNHSEDHLGPVMLLPPTGCLVCSVVAVSLDPAYAEAAVLWFSSALILAVPFFVMTFNRAYSFKEPDERRRLQKWAWVATPAVAAIALAALDGATQNPPVAGADAFSFAARALYLSALGLALMLGLLFVTGHSARVRFDMSSWALAFPLEALAIATQWYAAGVPGRLTTGMALAGLAIASGAVATLSLHTLHALLMGGIFVPEPKFTPLAVQQLTHEAFRAAGEKLKTAAAALGLNRKGAVNGAPLADFALQFRRYRLAQAWHSEHEEDVVFKEFEMHAPGLCCQQREEHLQEAETMDRWAGLIARLERAADTGAGGRAAQDAILTLQQEVPQFVTDFEEHMQGEEMHLQRGGRKHMSLEVQKSVVRRIWAYTPASVWSEFLPWIIVHLPMHSQRVKFVRCLATWAVPERAQLVGRMIANGVDSAVWVRLARDVPEIVPRGAPGWRKYY